MNAKAKPYKVLIVDDMPAVREGLRWLIEDEADLTVVGEANDGLEAIQLASEHLPDIVILDIELPEMDGYAVTRRLKTMPNPPVVVFLTLHSDAHFRQQAREAGADGFAEKGKGWLILLEQIRASLANRPATG
jgi:DNA-binding NarL/FixJ family response regulator